ncbi:cyclic pyranopterin monophosphate synthase MoaC [Saccharomonospora iraqiensis]|uniref:cyclic pyranopterin monophosphate synthase MoaC n=1 Tax=Saccharomonospora iraqiensis TaxID=52698 RepID=UPI000413A335|nr:cyclic pyranopterin monophosphate synthase MoaC [Saccharomonospora iraqiensis]
MSGQDGARRDGTDHHDTGPRDTGPHGTGRDSTEGDGRLSHVDESGTARMVDVSGKDVTARTAVARGTVRTTAEVIGLLTTGELPKGDAFATARIAGVMGAKRTSELIPLCHQIALSKVDLDFDPGPDHVVITATARTSDRTGVEMEALTAVAVAGLTLHDMVKAVDPAASLDEVRLVVKDGGKSGTWRREENR